MYSCKVTVDHTKSSQELEILLNDDPSGPEYKVTIDHTRSCQELEILLNHDPSGQEYKVTTLLEF